MSNLLEDKATSAHITDIFKSDEIFLKEFSRDFYQKIVDIDNFNQFEITLREWIKDIDKSSKTILNLMQKNEFLFSSIIGFFYQYGIGCDIIDKSKSLKLYSFAVNHEQSSNQKYTNLLEENGDEFYIMQNINTMIGKYLL